VGPCAVLALCIHPTTSHNLLNRISWAFCVYLEAVSVLPQLRVMQNTKIVEPFTAHYVFALGVARFLSCAHWVLQMLVDAFNLILCQHKCFCVEGKPSVLDSRGRLLVALGYGLWPSMCLWRAACSPSTLWGGLSEDAILLWSMSLLPKENITWLLMIFGWIFIGKHCIDGLVYGIKCLTCRLYEVIYYRLFLHVEVKVTIRWPSFIRETNQVGYVLIWPLPHPLDENLCGFNGCPCDGIDVGIGLLHRGGRPSSHGY
ncbi:hypothetical protein Goshw_029490, partial [Gossypium schwendimanii]|nr:hypothetical protein [Gossypium schwendimanii]